MALESEQHYLPFKLALQFSFQKIHYIHVYLVHQLDFEFVQACLTV